MLKIIGGELISDDVVAVTELVKNAHDADARTVTIRFLGVAEDDGVIEIIDDGHGMDVDTLLEGWMVPAGSKKGARGVRRTRKGRRMLGEKGVGRFATDKLAAELELISRVHRGKELRAVFNWDRFDEDERMLADVKNRWELREPQEIKRRGTILRLGGLRARWSERMFRRLSTRLSRLISPFDTTDDFKVVIDSDEFPEYSGEIRRDFLQSAPYSAMAEFDGRESIKISLNGKTAARHLWNGSGELTCGPVTVRLYAFDLETEAIARIGPRAEVRAWLREWSGISVYRDGFRLWPYGEPHDDWLRLDQRRVNNPVLRLSNNQIIGFVEIGRDDNPALIDQTNREGLVNNREFEDLRKLMYFVLGFLESERQSIRHPQKAGGAEASKGEAESREATIADELVRLAAAADTATAKRLRKTAERERKRRATEEQLSKSLLEGYADLAALGHASARLGDSVSPMLRAISDELESIREGLNGDATREVKRSLKSINIYLERVDRRVAMVTPLGESGVRRRRAVSVSAELDRFHELIEPLLEERGVGFEVALDDPLVRAEIRPEALGRVLHALVLNSLDWVDRASQPRIRVTSKTTEARCRIFFSDNGPGIPADNAQRVFQPLFTTREGARGMGLTIAREVVRQHAGEIEVVVDGRRKGATVAIDLARKRSRAT